MPDAGVACQHTFLLMWCPRQRGGLCWAMQWCSVRLQVLLKELSSVVWTAAYQRIPMLLSLVAAQHLHSTADVHK